MLPYMMHVTQLMWALKMIEVPGRMTSGVIDMCIASHLSRQGKNQTEHCLEQYEPKPVSWHHDSESTYLHSKVSHCLHSYNWLPVYGAITPAPELI